MKIDQISEEGIRRLVDERYARVRAGTELARIFHRAIPGDWGLHLATMRDFWSSVILTGRYKGNPAAVHRGLHLATMRDFWSSVILTGRYKGNPAAVHLRMEGMEPRLFDRRLELFSETYGELLDEGLAETLRAKALRIAESLKLALFYRPGRP